MTDDFDARTKRMLEKGRQLGKAEKEVRGARFAGRVVGGLLGTAIAVCGLAIAFGFGLAVVTAGVIAGFAIGRIYGWLAERAEYNRQKAILVERFPELEKDL